MMQAQQKKEKLNLIKKLCHEHLFVKDFDKNLKFLTETMKFNIIGTPLDKSLNVRLLKVGPDTVELIDTTQRLRQCKCAFLVDNIEKEIDELKKKGITIAESTGIAVAEFKELRFKWVLIRMTGEEKFDGGWVELCEEVDWK